MADPDHTLRRDIACLRCGAVAASVLIDPDSGGRGLTLTRDGFIIRKASFLSESSAEAIADAEVAELLHTLPSAFQGFICGECDGPYCASCWTLESPRFEDGEYAGVAGCCPTGHQALVDW